MSKIRSFLILALFTLETIATSTLAMEVTVIREDVIDTAVPLFGNGSGPSWNFGSPMIVRQGRDVWFSLSRPVEGVPPYANTIWQISNLISVVIIAVGRTRNLWTANT